MQFGLNLVQRKKYNLNKKQASEGVSQHCEAELEKQSASPNLIGSIRINTASLEAASDRVAALFFEAIEDTASNL